MSMRPKINWRVVMECMRVYKWNWADLSRKMGVGESLVSMVRHGKQDVTLQFATLLCHAIRKDYGEILIHPTVGREPSAREALEMTEQYNGNPWPVAYDKEQDERIRRQRFKMWRREQELIRRA